MSRIVTAWLLTTVGLGVQQSPLSCTELCSGVAAGRGRVAYRQVAVGDSWVPNHLQMVVRTRLDP